MEVQVITVSSVQGRNEKRLFCDHIEERELSVIVHFVLDYE